MFYFVTYLQRWGQHDVSPQHPARNVTEAYFVRGIVLSTVCIGFQFTLSSPEIRVPGFPWFVARAAEAQSN